MLKTLLAPFFYLRDFAGKFCLRDGKIKKYADPLEIDVTVRALVLTL